MIFPVEKASGGSESRNPYGSQIIIALRYTVLIVRLRKRKTNKRPTARLSFTPS